MDGASAHAQFTQKNMHSFYVSEWRACDGRGREYGEKAMKGDKGSIESSSLLTESQSEKINSNIDEVMMM